MEDTEEEFPHIPADLLNHLETQIPERCPEPEWSDRKIWIYRGRREVVRLLKRQFEDQNRNLV